MQIGKGVWSGIGNSGAGIDTSSSSGLVGQTVIFKVAGNDLQAVLDRNSSKVKRYT